MAESMTPSVEPSDPPEVEAIQSPTQMSGLQDGTSPSMTVAVQSGGSVIELGTMLGPYRLEQQVGSGGMGAVFKALHTKLGKVVAVKVLPAQLTSNPESVARFEREMLAVGKLNHPNIVQAFDAGEINGSHYLAMEYVDGLDLSRLVKDQGRMTVDRACEVIRQTALALAAAHESGLVHRDIKPSNILVVTQGGQVKLLDLGLALLGGEAGTLTELTTTGQTFGTPDYMAPEQWENAHSADVRTDLYALGCTLFYLLVGRPPYGGEGNKALTAKIKGHLFDPVPDLQQHAPHVPDGVAAIYHKLLAKNPSDRFQSGQEVAQALAPFTVSQGAVGTAHLREADPESFAATAAAVSVASRQITSSTPPIEQTEAIRATQPGRPNPPQARGTQAWLWRGIAAVGVLLCGVIIITIRNQDGTITKIEAPDTATVTVTRPTESTAKPAPEPKPSSPATDKPLVASKKPTQKKPTDSPQPANAQQLAAKSTPKPVPSPEPKAPAGAGVQPLPEQNEQSVFALNRMAAERALDLGGSVEVEFQKATGVSPPVRFEAGKDLPPESFVVRNWSVKASPTATNGDVEVLSKLRHLKSVNLSAPNINGDALPLLGRCEQLNELVLPLNVKSSQLKVLPVLPNMSMLWIWAESIDDEWRCLDRFPHLQTLVCIDDNQRVSFAALGQFTHLRFLSVSRSVPEAELVALQKQNSRLKVAAHAGADSHEVSLGQDPLRAACRQLIELGLPVQGASGDWKYRRVTLDNWDGNGITQWTLNAIPREIPLNDASRDLLSNLILSGYLDLTGCFNADKLARTLAEHRMLTTLDFKQTDLTDEGLRALEPMTGLHQLFLTGTRVTRQAVETFQQSHPDCYIESKFGKQPRKYIAPTATE